VTSTVLASLGVPVRPCPIAHYSGPCTPERVDTRLGVVHPANSDDVRRIIAWANKHQVPLSTFSSGPGPRRRGLTHASRTLVMDLSSMRRMLKVDSRDAVAVIEPGIDFKQLDEALLPHGLRSFSPLRPRAGKSVLASYLEREPFVQWLAHWDIVDPLGSAELIFGSGERFRCGTAALPGTLEEHWEQGLRYINAAGPVGTDFLRVLQGAQGTLGIVTWSAVLCEPLPAQERTFFINSATLEPLLSLSAQLSRRRLGSAHFMVNRLELACLLTHPKAPVRELAADLPAWSLVLRLSAGHELPQEHMELMESDLKGLLQQMSLQASATLADLPAEFTFANPWVSTPHRDLWLGAHREVFFLSPLDRVPKWIDLGHAQAGAEIGFYVQPRLQGRNAHVALTLPCRNDSGELRRADDTARHLAERCCAAGGFFSRPYGHWASMAYARSPSLQPFLLKTKEMLDPARILNPGRLCY
jgi:FAD/FMN-containing dehydrogenase